MNCACGQDLGVATVKTKGLCSSCKRSIWMQVARKYKPKSEAIAQGLNRRRQVICCHGNSPCYSRCGVEMGPAGWQPIAEEFRQSWFDKAVSS